MLLAGVHKLLARVEHLAARYRGYKPVLVRKRHTRAVSHMMTCCGELTSFLLLERLWWTKCPREKKNADAEGQAHTCLFLEPRDINTHNTTVIRKKPRTHLCDLPAVAHMLGQAGDGRDGVEQRRGAARLEDHIVIKHKQAALAVRCIKTKVRR